LEEGLKYLGFHLKPNDYKKPDWMWLLEKLDKRLKAWSNKWLSRAYPSLLDVPVVDSKGHTEKGKKDSLHLSLEREIE